MYTPMKHQTSNQSTIHNVSSSPFQISEQTPNSTYKYYNESQKKSAHSNQKITPSLSHKRGSLSPKTGRSPNNNNSATTPAKKPTKEATRKHGDDEVHRTDTQSSIKQQKAAKQMRLVDQLMANEQRKSEVVNIKVKQQKKQPPVVSVDDVEVWRMTNEQDTNISFQDSDIADEFEYLYDPSAYTPGKRSFSPQQQQLYNLTSPLKHKHRRQMSKTPNVKQIRQNQTLMQMSPTTSLDKYALASMMMQNNLMMERNDLIKRTCRELSNCGSPSNEGKSKRKKSLKQRKREFMKRMRQDISMRDTRVKTFEEVQEVIIKRMLNHKYNQTNQSDYDISKLLHSPSVTKPYNNQDQTMNTQTFSPSSTRYQPAGDDNLNSSTTQTQSNGQTSRLQNFLTPKKLKPKQAQEVYKRLMHYEERRVKAIQMLQNAKRMDEDSEYLQSVGSRKLTKKQKKECYNRLVQDAERRKMTLTKAKQQQILMLEEELKSMFKPQINNPSSGQKRKSVKKVRNDHEHVDMSGINVYNNQEKYDTVKQHSSTSLITHLKPGSNVCTGVRLANEVYNLKQQQEPDDAAV